MTKHNSLAGLNSRSLFLIILETESLRSRHQHGGVLGRALFLAYWQWALCCGSGDLFPERERASSLESLLTMTLIASAPTSMTSSKPIYCPEAPSPNTIALRIRALPCKFGKIQFSPYHTQLGYCGQLNE